MAIILLIFVSIFFETAKKSRRIKFDILVEISHSASSKNVFSDSTGRAQCDLFGNNERDWCGKKRSKNRRYDEDFSMDFTFTDFN